jgi:Tol biopolymer transport system component
MPDGTTLVFAGKSKPGVPYDLYTVATDGTALTRLTSDGASEPAPCANGSVVYVHNGDLWLGHADGRTLQLTRGGGAVPDCSRDSRTIAFVRNGALYTMYADGRQLRRLTPRDITVDGRPAFSPAGGQIAITTTNAPACADYETGQTTYSLRLIDLLGHVRRSTVIDREYCAEGNPEELGSVGWQSLAASS